MIGRGKMKKRKRQHHLHLPQQTAINNEASPAMGDGTRLTVISDIASRGVPWCS